MGFADVISCWRQRLARMVGETAQGCYASIERKVLRYFLWRHADAPYAAPPAQAEPLKPADAERSRRLTIDEGTRLRLGLKRSPKVNVIEDLQREDLERGLPIFVPDVEHLVAVEIWPHPRRHRSLVESVARTEKPSQIVQLTSALRDCQPVTNRCFGADWQALVRLIRSDGFVEFEVIRSPYDEHGTFVNIYTNCPDAPRFRNDELGEIIESLAAEYALPGGAEDAGDDRSEATERIASAASWPEL